VRGKGEEERVKELEELTAVRKDDTWSEALTRWDMRCACLGACESLSSTTGSCRGSLLRLHVLPFGTCASICACCVGVFVNDARSLTRGPGVSRSCAPDCPRANRRWVGLGARAAKGDKEALDEASKAAVAAVAPSVVAKYMGLSEEGALLQGKHASYKPPDA